MYFDTETVAIRNYTRLLHKSPKTQELLRSKIKDRNSFISNDKVLRIHRIPLDVKTRWHSTYKLLKALLLVYDHINDPDFIPVPIESVNRVRMLFPFFEQIAFLVLSASSESICTISQVIPSFLMLFDFIGERSLLISNEKFRKIEPYLRKNVFDKKSKLEAVFSVPPKINPTDLAKDPNVHLPEFSQGPPTKNIPSLVMPSPFALGRTAEFQRNNTHSRCTNIHFDPDKNKNKDYSADTFNQWNDSEDENDCDDEKNSNSDDHTNKIDDDNAKVLHNYDKLYDLVHDPLNEPQSVINIYKQESNP
jgi:hypothetical protein